MSTHPNTPLRPRRGVALNDPAVGRRSTIKKTERGLVEPKGLPRRRPSDLFSKPVPVDVVVRPGSGECPSCKKRREAEAPPESQTPARRLAAGPDCPPGRGALNVDRAVEGRRSHSIILGVDDVAAGDRSVVDSPSPPVDPRLSPSTQWTRAPRSRFTACRASRDATQDVSRPISSRRASLSVPSGRGHASSFKSGTTRQARLAEAASRAWGEEAVAPHSPVLETTTAPTSSRKPGPRNHSEENN